MHEADDRSCEKIASCQIAYQSKKNKQFMIELAKERDFFHAFRKSDNIDSLAEIGEKSEYIRSKFIGRDLNEERELKEILKERYSKYADILINKADDVKNTPILKVQAFVEIIRNVEPSRNPDNSNAEQLPAVDRKTP